MSLINDALKRAKNAQQTTPPTAPSPQLRPPEAAQPEERGMGMMIPLILVIFALIGLLALWLARQKAAAREPLPEAKPVAKINPLPETKPPVQIITASIPPAAERPMAVSNAPAPAVVFPIATLKLQAIFFSPGHSTAIINGKMVRAGDSYKGFRIAAITENSTTLISATETNVMTLDQ